MSRGGARPGAGRPQKADRRVTYTVRVTPETRETLREMRAQGCLIGEILEAAARNWRRASRESK
jgi:hypothetical protein